MRNYILIVLVLCLTYPILAQDEAKHTLAIGDTWERLEDRYDTCREAIIYQNDLSLRGVYSQYYVMTPGTILTVPPKSACDELPTGSTVHTVVMGETPMDIYAKYRLYPNRMMLLSMGDSPHPIFPDDELEPGEQISIPDIVPFYHNDAGLIVIPDDSYFDPIEHTLQVGDTLKKLATTYQTCREAIIWENQLTLPYAESIAYVFEAGDTLLIPPATACDDLPFGNYTTTIEERVTQSSLIRRYRQVEPIYYELNEPQEGLLQVGTQQTIPNAEYMYAGTNELQVVGDSEHVEPIQHIAQRGDSFFALAEQYNTCIEAILY